MPDITMCTNKECILKEKCYRHKATPSEFRQSYTLFVPEKDGNCDHFMETYKSKPVNQADYLQAVYSKLESRFANEKEKL